MVQTFLVDETKELIYDVDKLEEWKQKCQELGLNSQLALVSGDGKSPIPFEHMNTTMERVYHTLCPARTPYTSYSKTAIPLEVLGLIALAEKEKYFNEIEIWYDDKSPDPIVVGRKKTGAYSSDLYAIARWGDVLKPFEKLKEAAVKRYIHEGRIKLQRGINDLNVRLGAIDNNAQMFFAGEMSGYEVVGY